jgi:hypothetical protein
MISTSAKAASVRSYKGHSNGCKSRRFRPSFLHAADRSLTNQQRPQKLLGRDQGASDCRIYLAESWRQRIKGRVCQRSDHAQRVVLRHHLLRAQVAEHLTGLVIRPAHPLKPLLSQRFYRIKSQSILQGLFPQPAKAPPKDCRIVWGHVALNFGEGDSGAVKFGPDSQDDRHLSDSRTVHGG